MQRSVVRTGDLPQTLVFLRSQFPQVLRTKCFNDHQFSFRKEVRDTEIGHLFEHIVLASMCEHQDEARYEGWTEWDWKKDTRGTFHISLSVGKKEQKALQAAIKFATSLVTRLLATQTDGWTIQPSVVSNTVFHH
jgi:hypothetical protein